jgi:rifampin ADP-ribosylating transferase
MTNTPVQTNAQSVARYFHGGHRGLKVGDYILPPSETGRSSVSDFGAQSVHRKDRVYVTASQGDAEFFASASREPVVYEVKPEGQLEPDPDCISSVSFACPKAKIISIHKMSGKTIKKHRKAMIAKSHGATVLRRTRLAPW